MKKTIGVFAHVDAGKTTFCEALLHLTGKIRTPGRVDHGSTVMDFDEIEKRRGITIYSGISAFSHAGIDYQLIDTPGHTDFSAEAERAMAVLDAAILLISCPDGVQSHTLPLFRMLSSNNIPIFIFINKTDQPGASIEKCVEDIRLKLTPKCIYLPGPLDPGDDKLAEALCGFDDELFEHYIENGPDPDYLLSRLRRLISDQKLVLAGSGSALHGEGVLELLECAGAALADAPVSGGEFSARVFRTFHDLKGTQVALIRILQGSLTVRDEISTGENIEKAHEIRVYNGNTHINVTSAYPGDIVGVTGLTGVYAGAGLGNCPVIPKPSFQPLLRVSVIRNGLPHSKVMECLKKLEKEDPLLKVTYEPAHDDISIRIMGEMQLETIKESIAGKYGLAIDFGPCRILYKETIAKPVMGYGHFEPLRHYAEVHLRMEPNPGRGIEFASECNTDDLPRQYQNLIRHHVLDREHKGVLTASALTDVRMVLVRAAFHLKHTDGGDFMEAVCRAVRQGLEKAECVLLEPHYSFDIDVDVSHMGRVMSDITRLHGEFKAPDIRGLRATVSGSGPAEMFLNYPSELLSFTRGTGSMSAAFSEYLSCHDPERVIRDSGYEKERDLDNISSSVFCSKGAGFEVKWREVERYLHLPL